MKMIPVQSSAINAVGYDPLTGRMDIEFAEGNVYPFCGVPQSVFDGLLSASSVGGYYNQYIRDRYQCS